MYRAAVLGLALFAAACGQTTNATAPPGATSTTARLAGRPAAFVDRAHGICTGMQADAEQLTSGGPPGDGEVTRIVASWRSSLDELARLDAPAGVAAEYRKMLANYRKTLDAIDATVAAEDESVLAAVAGMAVFGHRGARAARRAAVPKCALFPEITQPRADPQPLDAATVALVPHGVEIVRAADDGCAADRSCRVEYRSKRSAGARLAAARELLAARGWRDVRSGKTPGTGAVWLMANRNDYAATVEIVSKPLPPHCKTGRVTWGCVDSVWVHRVEVPEAYLVDE